MKIGMRYEVWCDQYGCGGEYMECFSNKREAIKYAKSLLPLPEELFDDETRTAAVYELLPIEEFTVKPKAKK